MEKKTLVIGLNKSLSTYISDLVSYRELFYFFAWRDVIVRYKQAFFGAAWALFRPLLNMLAFTLIFGKIANLPSEHVNYGLFVLAAMLPWQLFAGTITDACTALINQTNLVSKVYFPRMIIPAAHSGVHLVDYTIALFFLLVLLPWFGISYHLSLLALPFFSLLVVGLALGSGFWLSAVTVRYRDFRLVVPFFVQFGMFISPVGYGSFLVTDRWVYLYALNPLVGIIDGFRWAFFEITHPHMLLNVVSSLCVTSLIFISGFCYFRKTETTFADTI